MTERRMRNVSQRNPAEPRPASDDVFGRMFQRGPSIAADGGEHGVADDVDADSDEGATDATDARPVDRHRMKDVDHTPPDEDCSANSVWERGGEQSGDDSADENDAVADDSNE